MTETTIQPMSKQVSALNTFWLIQYLRDHHPDVNPNEILNSLNQEKNYYIENLKTGKIEKVSLNHLIDTDYWFSNPFMIHLYNLIQDRVPDPNGAYKMGSTS